MRFSEKYLFLTVLLFLVGMQVEAGEVVDAESDAVIAACLPEHSLSLDEYHDDIGSVLSVPDGDFYKVFFIEECEVDQRGPDFQRKEEKCSVPDLPPCAPSLSHSSLRIVSSFRGENSLPYQFFRRYILFCSLLI